MVGGADTKRLLDSNRWLSFLESTAMGLQISLVPVFPEASFSFEAPKVCPSCGTGFERLSREDASMVLALNGNSPAVFTTGSGNSAVAIPIQEGFCVVARDCPCCREEGRLSLLERAGIAQKLLSSFQKALSEGLEGGQRAIELSTLRQMNHIVLTLIQGQGNALERAFNLILSALVILVDAQGSWLEYRAEDKPVLTAVGDVKAIEESLKNQNSGAVVVEVKNGCVHGRLGVLLPADPKKALGLLPMMAQECVIVFEIDYLFKLLQAQLTRVLGAVGSAVLLVDQHGEISYANKAAEQLLGSSALTLMGSPAAHVTAPWTAVLLTGPQRQVRGHMDPLGRGREARWVDWEVSPLNNGEKIAGWIILADDRTDYYRWQEAARQAERFATTATMLGSLAHELRNPLSAARGLLQLMGRKRDHEQIRSYRDLILREIDRVTRLLNEFLLLGKPVDIAMEPIDLAEFLHELMPLLEGEAAAFGVEIEVALEAVPPVAADPGQLTQVVLNLARNAIEAADRDGKVTLSLQKSPGGVVIWFRDNGPGMFPAVMEKLFQPFFTTKERGTGLGLSVVRAIVKNHGGEITAANAPEGGAVFTVVLPEYPGFEGKVFIIDVLIIVEDDLVRYPCEQALRTVGISVMSLTGLSEILPLADRLEPNVLVLEQSAINMEHIDLVRRQWPGARFLVLGEPGDLEGRESFQFLSRPIEYTRLINRIKFMLENPKLG